MNSYHGRGGRAGGGEAKEGPQLLTGIAKLGKRSTFSLLGQQATQATDEPQRRPLCVFDYKIKLRCGRKLAMPGTVQQTIAYCPTLHIRPHTQKYTHTHMWSNCCSEQLFGAYHLVKRIRFARQRRQRRFVIYVGKTIRLPCMCSTVWIRMCEFVCESVCVWVCTNQLIYSPRQSYEKTDNYIRSLLTIFACRKVSSGAQTPSFSFLLLSHSQPLHTTPFSTCFSLMLPLHAVSAVSCSTYGEPTEQQLYTLPSRGYFYI